MAINKIANSVVNEMVLANVPPVTPVKKSPVAKLANNIFFIFLSPYCFCVTKIALYKETYPHIAFIVPR